MREARLPILVAVDGLVAVLLVLPVVYAGCYSALVQPGGRIAAVETAFGPYVVGRVYHYRVDGELPELIFWPLEQLDRSARPTAWNDNGILPFPLP